MLKIYVTNLSKYNEGALVGEWVNLPCEGLEEVRQGNYTIYENCDNMEDVAYQAVNESGLLDGVPEQVKMYFDYEAYGRDMEINGTFIQIDNSFVELY